MNLFRRSNSPITSPEKFRDLYEKNRLPVFRYIFGLMGGSQDEAEDLTAETFLRAWKARHRFEGDMDSAIGWLIRIAKRLVIDNYRRSLQASRHPPSDILPGPMPEQVVIDDEQNRILFALLTDLPGEQREIIVLRYMLGWRVNDIAHHIGATENNVSVMIHRTLAKLRDKWLDIDPERLSLEFVREEKIS
ncbi:MAG: sigma-70 family RNA polymerase sigma factor [Anaerolineales bacterium]|jgi:RNA polymerase sigma-70 factor (ECF subfamily)|nr:sigma-70 family RNA polymerase sigma factor [Anaerolineales bacterium]